MPTFAPATLKKTRPMDAAERQKTIYKVTIAGSAVNALLVAFKYTAGLLGGSAAMIADATHSLTDFLTDIVVMLFVRLGNKPEDKSHDYGHGKYETLATAIIGIALTGVGIMILYNGLSDIYKFWQGKELTRPGWIALVAALASIALKEWTYRFTAKAGRAAGSPAVIANAWHHRSDALSSIGTAAGIGGAIILGDRWTVLDPIAAVIVSWFIIKVAYRLLSQSMGDLLEQSLPDDTEQEIQQTAESEPDVSEVHHIRTRRLGNHIAIEMHIRMPGTITLREAHRHATRIEQRLKARYGLYTHVIIHMEPLKIGAEHTHAQ